jgi:hypothetical protein
MGETKFHTHTIVFFINYGFTNLLHIEKLISIELSHCTISECIYLVCISTNILHLQTRMGEEGKLYSVLEGKPEGKRPLVRPRHRWEDGIRMDLR